MRTKLKRGTALLLAALMLLLLLPTGVADNTYSEAVIPAMQDGGALLAETGSESEAGDGSDGQKITIMFEIDNSDYVCDPDSNHTHLTTTDVSAWEQVTKEKPDGWQEYQITSCGIIYSCEITRGTSLSDNDDCSMPAINVKNISDTDDDGKSVDKNRYRYVSPVSWVKRETVEGTETETVCTVNTVFNESTTLYLQLYKESEKKYSLDFVCDGNGHKNMHNIATGGSFTLGQCVSQDVIEAAKVAAKGWWESSNSSFCKQGCPDISGREFVGWQLKKTETGVMVNYDASVPLTAEYVNTQYGNSIKVYAVWGEKQVTATFVYEENGETKQITQKYTSGAVLSKLSELPSLDDNADGAEFVGWQYEDASGTKQIADENTVITADTTYTACFAKYYDVTLYDLMSDDSPADPDIKSIDVLVKEGTTLAEALAEVTLSDGASAAECIWYTRSTDENGSEKQVDLTTTAVTRAMELYTYTYTITLTLSPADTQAAIATYALIEVEKSDDGTLILILTVRAGETLTAADFVYEGVDYSLYTWKKVDGSTLDIQSLIGTTVTDDIKATSVGTPSNAQKFTINFYVSINGEWTLWETQTMTAYLVNSGTNGETYALTVGQLQSVYGRFGFNGLNVNEAKIWHAGAGGTYIYGDRAAFESNGVLYSPILRSGDSCDVYYLPNNTGTEEGSRDGYKAANTFYTVTVEDPAHKVYQTDNDIPAVTYWLTGDEAIVSVDNAGKSVTWQCVVTDGTTVTSETTITSETTDGVTTFTISGISQPYTISPTVAENETRIVYDLNIKKKLIDENGTPTVNGSTEYTTDVAASKVPDHTVLAPSYSTYQYIYENDKGEDTKYLGEATFTGWNVTVEGTKIGTIGVDELNDGATLGSLSGLANVEYAGKTITLTAQWTYQSGNSTQDNILTSSMVNFYVSINAVSEGETPKDISKQTEDFTDSVYTADCGVTGKMAGMGLGSQQALLGYEATGTANMTLTELDGEVRKLITAQLLTTNNKTNYYQLTFPSDETVLQNVRTMVAGGKFITINGYTITADELTTENFTVRWYVFKFDNTDGWHVDGILVAKQGTMTVTKTFAGDETAIEAMTGKESTFKIIVEGGISNTSNTSDDSDDSSKSESNTQTLYLAGATQKGNTYTWTVPVDQYYNYSVTENGYIYSDDDDYITTAQYNVTGSSIDDVNTDGWVQGVEKEVTAQGQNLVVSFLNTYIAPGTIQLKKVDANTGNGISGVKFTLEGGNIADGGLELTTGEGGSVQIEGLSADTTYTLTETTPEGYEPIGQIGFTVAASTDGTNKRMITRAWIDGATEDDETVESPVSITNDGITLQVKNTPKTGSLTVKKVWVGGTAKQGVTIQLYCNDTAVAGKTVTFEADEATEHKWTTTFTDIPLYVDGVKATYSLKETQIGGYSYSGAYTGGYRYYTVQYDPVSVTPADKDGTSVLTVKNTLKTGGFDFTKTDGSGKGLADATFSLYQVPGSTEANAAPPENFADTSYKTATSGDNGSVIFSGLPVGSYYMIEHKAPDGYECSTDVYRFDYENDSSALYKWNGSTWGEPLSGTITIANERSTVDVNITKQVTGNMGDRNKKFEFTVTSTEAIGSNGTVYNLSTDKKTATFSLAHGESITLKDVPIGAELEITEGDTNYTMSIAVNSEDNVITNPVTVASDTETIFVINHKEATIDTGVLLDSLPYILILAVVLGIGAFMFIRKRRDRDDD